MLDVVISRKVANNIPVYLRKVAGDGGHPRFDTAANAERALNMCFKYASRRLQVPHIHPGYARDGLLVDGHIKKILA